MQTGQNQAPHTKQDERPKVVESMERREQRTPDHVQPAWVHNFWAVRSMLS